MTVCRELALPSLQAESMDGRYRDWARPHAQSTTLWIPLGASHRPCPGNQNRPGCTWCPLASTWKTLIAPKVAPARSCQWSPSLLHEPPALSSARLSGSLCQQRTGLGTRGQDRTDNNKP